MITPARSLLSLSALLGALLLSACSSTPLTSSTAPASSAASTTPASKVTPVMPAPVVAKPVTVPVVKTYLDPSSAIFKSRSVYFDFDQYVVKPEFMQSLELHGKYLAANASVSIKVEGNTDEQGGAEYNLALGQRRADAVTKVLKVFGARDAQLESVSFGKEKPKSQGHEEFARAQNRRVDLAYPKD